MSISYFTTYPLLVISFIALIFFVYAIIKANNRDKINPADAVQTMGEIVNIRSSSGENSSFINVVIQVRFNTQDNKSVISEGRATIDVIKIPEYQKGAKVPLIYSKKEPKKIRLQISSPLDR